MLHSLTALVAPARGEVHARRAHMVWLLTTRWSHGLSACARPHLRGKSTMSQIKANQTQVNTGLHRYQIFECRKFGGGRIFLYPPPPVPLLRCSKSMIDVPSDGGRGVCCERKVASSEGSANAPSVLRRPKCVMHKRRGQHSVDAVWTVPSFAAGEVFRHFEARAFAW